MKKIIIVAAAQDNAIGKDNDLLVHMSTDLKRFKSLTMGHPIIMGRKTFESIGKALAGRTNIVVTSNPDVFAAKYDALSFCKNIAIGSPSIEKRFSEDLLQPIAVSDMNDAFAAAALSPGSDICFITGGASIYAQSMQYADELDITRIRGNFPQADTFFPTIAAEEWEMGEESEWMEEKDKKSTSVLKFRFERWIRR